MKNTRKPIFFGSVAIGAFLALSSIAFACTRFQGQMTVTGDSGTTVTAVGDGRSMSWCSITGTASIGPDPLPYSRNLQIAVAPATCNGTSTQLGRGTYDVNWVNNEAMTKDPVRDWLIDCMSPISLRDRTLGTVNVGTMSVDSNGNGSANVSVTATKKNIVGESAVCVSSADGRFGNQAPVTVL